MPSPQAQLIAQSIGQAFSVAYQEFLRANGINPEDLSQKEYSDLVSSQEMYNDDLVHFSNSENCKEVRPPPRCPSAPASEEPALGEEGLGTKRGRRPSNAVRRAFLLGCPLPARRVLSGGRPLCRGPGCWVLRPGVWSDEE